MSLQHNREKKEKNLLLRWSSDWVLLMPEIRLVDSSSKSKGNECE